MWKNCFVLVAVFLYAVSAWAGGNREAPAGVRWNESNPMIRATTVDTVVAVDAGGSEVVLKKHPARTAILFSSMVDLWYMAGGTAVGRPTITMGSIPEEAKQVTTLGHVANPNVEKLFAVGPDFVILSYSMETHRKIKELLDQAGIRNILLNYETVDDFAHILDLFSQLTGSKDTSQMIDGIKRKVESVIASVSTYQRPTFLSLFVSTQDLHAETSSAHTARMAELLGGRNIVGERGRGGGTRITYSLERIVQQDPDVILITTMGTLEEIKKRLSDELSSNPAWDGLKATKNGRVHFLPTEYFLYKPNRKYPEAFEYLAKLLYPELAK